MTLALRRLPTPGRSIWWLVAACGTGVFLPILVGSLTALAAYYPIGSHLTHGHRYVLTGTLVTIVEAAAVVSIGGVIYSLLAWSGRSLFLSIIVLIAMTFGAIPGLFSHSYLRGHAFHLLALRSSPLVAAVEEFQKATGTPPESLADLVPRYLPAIPKTGMSAYPDYKYAKGSGSCSDDSPWQISVDAGDILNWDYFFYCPRRNYPTEIGGDWVEIVGDWAYLHE